MQTFLPYPDFERKGPEHYGAVFDDVPDDLDYVWPGPTDATG
jgi:hypothetical protein